MRIDPRSSVPVSEQLRARVADRIRSGGLLPGDRLPTVRALADQVGLSPNTVAKAYRALEREGLVVGRGRLGTFVVGTGSGDRVSGRLRSAAEAFATRARRLGARPAEALEAVRIALLRN